MAPHLQDTRVRVPLPPMPHRLRHQTTGQPLTVAAVEYTHSSTSTLAEVTKTLAHTLAVRLSGTTSSTRLEPYLGRVPSTMLSTRHLPRPLQRYLPSRPFINTVTSALFSLLPRPRLPTKLECFFQCPCGEVLLVLARCLFYSSCWWWRLASTDNDDKHGHHVLLPQMLRYFPSPRMHALENQRHQGQGTTHFLAPLNTFRRFLCVQQRTKDGSKRAVSSSFLAAT